MLKYAVYLHKRKDNGEAFYVGCCKRHDDTRCLGIKRYRRAFDFGQRTEDWFNVVKDAGGVEVEFVFYSDDRQEAFDKEKYYIRMFGRLVLNNGKLVNQCAGGAGASEQPNSEETKAKKSAKQKGEKNSMYGKRGIQTGTARRVINVKTSKIYESVTEAAECNGYDMKVLYNWLIGHRKNRTDLRLLQ